MVDRTHRTKIAARGLAVLVLLLTSLVGAATSVAAQGADELYSLHIRANTEGGGATFGAQFTVTTEDGEFLGACTLEGDESSPPWAYCWVDVPKGIIVSVWQDPGSIPAGYAPVENPIRFDTAYPTTTPHKIDVAFHNVPHTGNTSAGQISDVAGDPSSDSGSVDIALITRDPDTGDLLTGTCYVLVDYSNEGCDENGDGQVTFADIPYGTYTVHQTRTPAGYPTINDYDINVEPETGQPFRVPLGYIVKQAPEQNAPNTRNVSVVFIDSSTGKKVVSDICVEFVGASNVGCDEDLRDGQVDFIDVPAGLHELGFSNLPAGLNVAQVGGPLHADINAEPGAPANQFHYILLSQTSQDTSSNSAGSAQETWTASVQVNLCDAPPNSGLGMNCHAEAGIVVDISHASGEWLGSCTVGAPQPTPWGVSISTCVVEGMPFNADLVATQDPSTIPAGYEPSEDSISLRVDHLIPGGGDQATFTFFNVRSDAASAGSANMSGSGGSVEATVLMTFRGCPEGFVPDVTDPYTACTIPLDAPDASRVGEWGVGQSLVPITGLQREFDGSYIFHVSSGGGYYLELTGLEPVLRDGFLIYGVDDQDGSSYITLLDHGETREIFIFYYYE